MGEQQEQSQNNTILKGLASHGLPEIEANSIHQPCSSPARYHKELGRFCWSPC